MFICKTGTGSPASKYGGTWNCVAENIKLPITSNATVTYKTNGNAVALRKTDGGEPWYNSNTTIKGVNEGNQKQVLQVYQDGAYNYKAIIDPQGTLVANLSEYIVADVWQRIEED